MRTVTLLAALLSLAAPAAAEAKKPAAVATRCLSIEAWRADLDVVLEKLDAAPQAWPAGPALDRLVKALPELAETAALAKADTAVAEEVRYAGTRLEKALASLKEPLARKHAGLTGPALRRIADALASIHGACPRRPGAAGP